MVTIKLSGRLETTKAYLEMMPPPPGVTLHLDDGRLELPKPFAEQSSELHAWLFGLLAAGDLTTDDEALATAYRAHLEKKRPKSWFESLMAAIGI